MDFALLLVKVGGLGSLIGLGLCQLLVSSKLDGRWYEPCLSTAVLIFCFGAGALLSGLGMISVMGTWDGLLWALGF